MSSSFTYPPSIAYPPPPPTNNALTAEQRSHLIRSSKKLERVLGDTPRFVDSENIEAMSPRSPRSSISRSSVDSQLSNSSSQSPRVPLSSNPFASPDEIKAGNSWRKSKRLPPLLRLAINGTSRSPTTSNLSTIPESPSIPVTNVGHYRVSSASGTHPSQSVAYSPGIPTFTIPSDSSMRRDKMDRLRRKFGDDVPVDLVFPREKVRSRKHQRSDAVNVITIPADSRIPHSPQHTVMIKTSTVSRKTQPSLKGSGPLSSIIESAELGVESGEQQGLLGPRRRPTAGSSIGSKEYLAHRRQKMNGHPAIEPVGFLGTTF